MTTTTAPTTVTDGDRADDARQNAAAEQGYADLLAGAPVVDGSHLFDAPDDDDGWLTDEQVQLVEQSMPRCPTCGGGIDAVHFIAHQTHGFFFEIDGRNGEVLAHSRHDDTTWVGPVTTVLLPAGMSPTLPVQEGVVVECEQGHEWYEPRLRLRKRDSTGEDWEISS